MENFDTSGLNGKLLNIFLAIFDTNSVSAAALKVGLNQSTISYSLDKLRDAFGDPLFIKSGRGIAPTERAIMLAPQIRNIANDIENLTITKSYEPTLDTVPFSIATNVTELLPFCEKLHQNIEQLVPAGRVRFLELGSRENIMMFFDSLQMDLIISVRMANLPNSLNSELLYSSELVCFYDPEFRGPPDSLEKYSEAGHAVLDFGGAVKSTVEAGLEKFGLQRKIQLGVPDALVMSRLMKGTNLITTMQRALSQSTFSDFAYCEPPISLPKINFDLIWHRRFDNSPRSLWLRGIVRTSIEELTTKDIN